jgi:hypothetical protein
MADIDFSLPGYPALEVNTRQHRRPMRMTDAPGTAGKEKSANAANSPAAKPCKAERLYRKSAKRHG